jgi:ferric-dicitrate binding protein FerR (iron transport regulator)
MKWNCELIQDLLPLYEEELCSPTSRQAVQEHQKECEHCRRLTAPLPIEMPHEIPEADHAVKKSIKKVKRRWLASLLAAVLAVPLLLLSLNQHQGSGLCFTNLDDVYTAWQFLHALD